MVSLDLAERRFVITGANTGVGRATAEALAARGAEVWLACRSEARAAEALETIAAGPGRGRFVEVDLGCLEGVARAADALAAVGPFDALINNAGVGGARGQTVDGFELAFGVNHLGHFLWTRRLLGSLRSGGVVVHLGSGSHERAGRPRFDAFRRPTSTLTGVREYATSKLCVMLFHHELSRRLDGVSARSIAVDPGDVASDAFRHVPWLLRAILTRGMPTPEAACVTSVACATDPSFAHGGLYAHLAPRAPAPLTLDLNLAAQLWARSEAWVEETLARASRGPAPSRRSPSGG